MPQVDRELIKLVVAQISMGQDAVEEGEAQQALTLQGLREKGKVLGLGLGCEQR